MHLQPQPPSADPLPWVTAQMRRGRVFDRRLSDATRMRAALDVLTRNVSALHDDHPYRVVLSKSLSTAGTAYRERLVIVGSKPLYDDDLTEGQQAAVVMGLVLHEVGHVRWGREYDDALERSPVGNSKVVGSISNLAADMHNERAAMDLFPGLAHAVEVAMWWVDKQQPRMDIDLTTVAGRCNAALAAARYPWTVDWSGHPDWLATWTDWARRAEQSGSPKQHVAIVSEALDIIRDLPDPEPQAQQDDPDGEPEPGDDGDSDDTGDGDTGHGDDDGDDADDTDGDGSGPADGEDADDAEDGDDGQPGGEPGNEPGDEQDGDGAGEGAGDDDSDEPGEPGEPGEGDDGDADDGTGGEPTGDGEPSEQGGTGGMSGDPYDEDSDDVRDACATHTAHDERDEQVQDAIDGILLSERTSGTTYTYRHNTSVYSHRKVVVAKKTASGYRL